MTRTNPLASTADAAERPLPSQGFRTIVSLLLFVHLFALGVAMVSNPRDGMTSPLLLRLGGVPFLSGYLQLVWMDLGYDYFHTYGNNEFVAAISSDHLAEIELTMPDGSTKTIVSPDPDDGGLSRMRYTNLWNNSGRTIGQSGIESMLPDMVTESLLREHGATTATIRIRRIAPLTIEAARSRSGADAEATALRTVYTGVGQLTDGEFLYQKLESTGDTAPAVGAPATAAPPAANPPSGPRSPSPIPGTRSSGAAGAGPSTSPRPLFPVDR